jgi:hypothetical protein
MTNWIVVFFAWPLGGVWSNIIASFIWSAAVWFPTMLHLHRKVDRQHAEITQQNKQLRDEAQRHHTAVREHLGMTTEEQSP